MSAPRHGWTLSVTGTCAIPDSWEDHIYICSLVIFAPLGGPTCPHSLSPLTRHAVPLRSSKTMLCSVRMAPVRRTPVLPTPTNSSALRTPILHQRIPLGPGELPCPTQHSQAQLSGVTGPGTVTPRYSATPPGRMTTSVAWPRAASMTTYHHLCET